MSKGTLFLDIESTGLGPDKSIIQIAAEYYLNGNLVSSFNKKCKPNPTEPISVGALVVNHGRMSELFERSDRREVAHKFVDYLLSLPKDETGKSILIGGHNVRGDIFHLNKFLAEHNIIGMGELMGYRTKDTATIAEFLIDAGVLDLKNFNLEKLAKALDVKVTPGSEQGKEDCLNTLGGTFHDAAYDTRITALCYFKMIELVKGLKSA